MTKRQGWLSPTDGASAAASISRSMVPGGSAWRGSGRRSRRHTSSSRSRARNAASKVGATAGSSVAVATLPLQAETLHLLRGVALAGRRVRWEGAIERRQIVGAELNTIGDQVLFEIVLSLGARDRHDVGAARQGPGDRDRGGGAVLGLGDRLDRADQREIVGQVVALIARHGAPAVVLLEHVERLDRRGQARAAERDVRREAAAEGGG